MYCLLLSAVINGPACPWPDQILTEAVLMHWELGYNSTNVIDQFSPRRNNTAVNIGIQWNLGAFRNKAKSVVMPIKADKIKKSLSNTRAALIHSF